MLNPVVSAAKYAILASAWFTSATFVQPRAASSRSMAATMCGPSASSLSDGLVRPPGATFWTSGAGGSHA